MDSEDWKPDKHTDPPVYQQIAHYIAYKIARGDLIVGDKLPSQRVLSTQFGVNRSTIVEAMDELKAMGLLQGFHSQGTKVINNTWSSLLSRGTPNWKQYIAGGLHESNLPTIQTINKLEFDPDYIRLGTGELSPDLFPRDMFQTILQRLSLTIHSLQYLEPKGLKELRESLSQYLRTIGIDAPASNILIVSGALQALQLISIGLLSPGSKVYVESPSYLKSLNVFQSFGMKLEGVEMDDAGIIPWLMKPSPTDQTEILYTIPTYHNPTGVTMSEARRHELLQWSKARQLPIIEDDCYRELWFDKEPPPSLKSKDQSGMVLYLGSVSKSLAPGLRIGWLVGPESIIDHLGDIKMQMDYGSSSVSQWILAEWMQSGLYQQHLSQLRIKLQERRDFTLQLLNRHLKSHAQWKIPQGGFYIWLKLNSKLSTEKLFKEALQQKVLLNPGSMYDFSKNQYLRLSYAYASIEQLEKGIVTLAALIKRYS
ncbi:PLP-dependent aminotransferase family protein [Paenibacillus sp. NPDC058071]|uniref:MocR-like pyridoxine biosynthesis transcription factor PdxR n=1 Tax=Paenibacillus sp. NPDC058071 TaxID=3346326 RepID=UPI0036DD061A